MVPLLLVLLLVLLFGGFGFVLHMLWWVAIVALVIWAFGFVFGGGGHRVGGRRRGWYRW